MLYCYTVPLAIDCVELGKQTNNTVSSAACYTLACEDFLLQEPADAIFVAADTPLRFWVHQDLSPILSFDLCKSLRKTNQSILSCFLYVIYHFFSFFF